MDDLDKWLTENASLNTENRVSLENLVISQEGFFDRAKEFIFGGSKKSNKGDNYKPVRLEHTYNFKATITAISRQYGDSAWLAKQNWVWRGSRIDATGIDSYLDDIEPKEMIFQLERAGEFCLQVHKDWLKAVESYFKAVKPVVGVLGAGLTDEALKEALTLLKRVPKPGVFYKNAPTVFPVNNRKIPKQFSQITPPLEHDSKIAPLDKAQAEQAVKLLIKQLEALVLIRDEFTKVAFAVVAPIQSRPLISLTHSKNPKVPEGSNAKLKDWVTMAERLDPAAVFWSSEEFAIVRRYYGDVVLAACRWIDRSIR